MMIFPEGQKQTDHGAHGGSSSNANQIQASQLPGQSRSRSIRSAARELVVKRRPHLASDEERALEKALQNVTAELELPKINPVTSIRALERRVGARVVDNEEVVSAVCKEAYHHLRRHAQILEVGVVAQVFDKYLHFSDVSTRDRRAFFRKATNTLRAYALDRKSNNPIQGALRVLVKYAETEYAAKRRLLDRPPPAKKQKSKASALKSTAKKKGRHAAGSSPSSSSQVSRRRRPGYEELAGIMQKSLFEVQTHTSSELGRHRNLLILGDSGSGKTLIVETVAEELGLPFLDVDCSNITEAGYVGDDASALMARLLELSGGKPRIAEGGIVLLDELDKLAGDRSVGGERDVTGAGAQRALLKLVHGFVDPETGIDTSKVLFIAAGSFEGLDEIVARRRGLNGLGFGTQHVDEKTEGAELLKQVIKPDLEDFGMFRELLGRIGSIVATDPMTEERMLKILNLPRYSPIEEERRFLAGEDVELRIKPEVKLMIVRAAALVDVGARGLGTTVSEVFSQIERLASDLSPMNRRRVTVDKAYVLQHFADTGKFTDEQLRFISGESH